MSKKTRNEQKEAERKAVFEKEYGQIRRNLLTKWMRKFEGKSPERNPSVINPQTDHGRRVELGKVLLGLVLAGVSWSLAAKSVFGVDSNTYEFGPDWINLSTWSIRKVGSAIEITDLNGNLNQTLTLGVPLAVGSGGTGISAAGPAGNVLTSNGLTFASSPPLLPFPSSYIIYQSGSNYYALNGATGSITDVSTSTDANAVIGNGTNGVLTLAGWGGGLIQLVGNTSFNYNTSLTFTANNNGTNQTIIRGQGDSSQLLAATAGVDAIVTGGGCVFGLEKVRVVSGTLALGGCGRAFFGSNLLGSGSFAEVCLNKGSFIRDCTFVTPNSATIGPTHIVELINPFQAYFNNINITGSVSPTSGPNSLMHIQQSSTSTTYGNCSFDYLNISPTALCPAAHALVIDNAQIGSSQMNLLKFNYLQAFGPQTYSGSHSVHLDQGVTNCWFNGCDFEGADVSIYLTGTTGDIKYFNGNHGFQNCYANCHSNSIQTNGSYGNEFFSISCAGSGGSIVENGLSSGTSNVYQDITMPAAATITISGGNPIFRGTCGGNTAVQYLSNSGVSTQNGDNSSKNFNIAHGLKTTGGLTPRYVQVSRNSAALTEALVGAMTYAIGATNIVVTFATAPATATGNVVLAWAAAL